MTKKELSKLYYLNQEIRRQRERLVQLEAVAAGCTARITGMPKDSMTSDRVGRFAAQIADLSKVIEENLQKAWQELQRISRFVQEIDDPLIQQLIHLRFIEMLSWKEIENAIGGGNNAESLRKRLNRYLERCS